MAEYVHDEGYAGWDKGDRFPESIIRETKWWSKGLVEALIKNEFIEKPKKGWANVKKPFVLMDKLASNGKGAIQFEDGVSPGASFIYFGGEGDMK